MPKHLSVDNALDGNLKPVKDSDGTPCALEVSTDKARVKSLEISGEAKGQTPTTGDGLATKQYVDDNAGGGGTSYWIQQWGARAYTKNLNWHRPNAAYGVAYYNWNHNTASTALPTSWGDGNNPCIVIPKDCTLIEYNFTGSVSSAQTYQIALLKGTGVTYGSAGDYTLSNVGSTREQVAGTANILYSVGETGLSVSLSKGDMLIPFVRRTTTNTTSTYYFKLSMCIICELN